MAEHVCASLREEGVKTESLRMVDFAILPGVEADMGDGDEWPKSAKSSWTQTFS